jgi:hypothetical protein
MKQGTVILCKTLTGQFIPDLFIKIVQKVTKSEYYHSKIYVNGFIYEAVLCMEKGKIVNGVTRTADLNQAGGDFWELRKPLTQEEINAIDEFLTENLKKKYDVMRLMFMPLLLLLSPIWKITHKIPFIKNMFFCFDLVERAFMYAGIDLFAGLPEGIATARTITDSGYFKDVK